MMLRQNEFTTAMTLIAHSTPTKHNTPFQETFNGDFRKVGDPRLWLHILTFTFGYPAYIKWQFDLARLAYLGDIDNWEKTVESLRFNEIEYIAGCGAFLPLFLHSEEYEKRAVLCVKNSVKRRVDFYSQSLVLFFMSLFCREKHLLLIFQGDEQIADEITKFMHKHSFRFPAYYTAILNDIRFVCVMRILYDICLNKVKFDQRMEYICQNILYDNEEYYDTDFVNSPDFDKPIIVTDGKESISVKVFMAPYAIRKTTKAAEVPLSNAELKIKSITETCRIFYIYDIRDKIDYGHELESAAFDKVLRYEGKIWNLRGIHSFYHTVTYNCTKLPVDIINKLFHMKKRAINPDYRHGKTLVVMNDMAIYD